MSYAVDKDVLRRLRNVFHLLIRRPMDLDGARILGLAQQHAILLPHYNRSDAQYRHDWQMSVQHRAMQHHQKQRDQAHEPAPGRELEPATEHESQDAYTRASDIQRVGA